MTTDYIPADIFSRLLDTMTPQNALVLECCMCTGMRISDVLGMSYQRVKEARETGERFLYLEMKTKKTRTVYLAPDWIDRALHQHDVRSPWLFAGREPSAHRTRQAVWKDLHRAAKLYRVNGKRLKATVGSHTARKIYAVRLYQETAREGLYEPLEAVKVDLNHSDLAVTYLYALADVISDRKKRSLPPTKNS